MTDTRAAEAFCFHKRFEPGGPFDFEMDRHYLLCALRGVLRLEAVGKVWTLPPARAAIIRAGCPVKVSILSPMESASVLFAPEFMEPPEQPLSVFDMSPLARELVRECREWTSETAPLGRYGRCLFTALAEVTRRLASSPTPCVLPAASSAALRKAMQLTEERAGGSLTFNEIALDTGQSPRALARRFSEELGMTWSQLLRRIRIIRAVEALGQTDAPVTHIAGAVGYESLSSFNAAFKDIMKMTPTRYRASFKDSGL